MTAGPRPLGFLPWLFASLALHGLVLTQWPRSGAPLETAADRSGELRVQVRLLHSAVPDRPASARPPRATTAIARKAPAVSAPSRAARTPRIDAVSSRGAARGAQPQNLPDSMMVATEGLRPAAVTRTVRKPAYSAAAPAASGGAADSDAAAAGWPELMALLHAAIDRHKRYPQSALSMGREGSARVDFRLRPDGHIDDVNIGVSSGVRALDLAAYRAVQGITPFRHADRYLDSAQRFQVDVVFRIN